MNEPGWSETHSVGASNLVPLHARDDHHGGILVVSPGPWTSLATRLALAKATRLADQGHRTQSVVGLGLAGTARLLA